MVEGYFKSLVMKVQTQMKEEPGDYKQDGLLYCGKCHTARQMELVIFGVKQIVPILCDCRREEHENEQRAYRAAQRKAEIDQARAAGISDKTYSPMRFENSDCELNFAKNYVENWKRMYRENIGLMIWGDTGTGKTFAAGCIANALIERGYRVYIANVMTMCDRLKEMYAEDRGTFIRDLSRYDLLVIDDFGAERKSEFVQEQIYTLIETRYRSGKPMIITTNISLDDLRNPTDMQSERIYDRIKERCHPVRMQGESRRRGIANSRYWEIEKLLREGS